MRIRSIEAFSAAAALFAWMPALASGATDQPSHPPGHQMKPAEDGAMDHDSHCGMPMGEGVINAVDVKGAKATIAHGPIAAIGWDKMTMTFVVEKPVDLAAFAAGDKVHFLLKEETSKKTKTYSVAAMCATDAAKETHEACMAQMHKVAMDLAAKAGTPCMMDDMGMKGMQHDHKDPDAAKQEQDHGDHQ